MIIDCQRASVNNYGAVNNKRQMKELAFFKLSLPFQVERIIFVGIHGVFEEDW